MSTEDGVEISLLDSFASKMDDNDMVQYDESKKETNPHETVVGAPSNQMFSVTFEAQVDYVFMLCHRLDVQFRLDTRFDSVT